MESKPNIMKRRMMLLQKLLYKTTDEQHPVTTFEILEYLESEGIHTNRKTLKGDIDLMIECGMDIIVVPSKPNKYFWGTRTFELAELKLLIDAISSSRFISQSKSNALTKKLTSLANSYDQKNLKRHVYATNRIKASNESLLYIVDTVNSAIILKKKIYFQYTEYAVDKKKILRNDGEVYSLSPYALFWNEDYYYVVGYSDKHDNVSVFRADRICHIEIADEKAAKKPDDFSIEKYSQQIFEMYEGDIVQVKLQCRNELMKYVIDRFGEGVETEIASETSFFAYADVSLSPTFYSWVFKFGGEVRILSPSKDVNEILAMTQKLMTAETI